MIRGLGRRGTDRLGNFWVDLVRSLLYVLIPLTVVISIVLVATGVPQTLEHYVDVHAITGLPQTIAIGPVASQEVIKLLSGDGGGFFNTNSAHPFENPTAVSNMIEALLMLLIPGSLHLDLREDDRPPAPGLGALWRDDRAVRRRHRGDLRR